MTDQPIRTEGCESLSAALFRRAQRMPLKASPTKPVVVWGPGRLDPTIALHALAIAFVCGLALGIAL